VAGGLILLTLPLASSSAWASSHGPVRFQVLDPITHRPLPSACVTIEAPQTHRAAMTLYTGLLRATPTDAVDLAGWRALPSIPANVEVITLLPGEMLTLEAQAPPGKSQQPPTRDIFVVVRASLLRRNATQTGQQHIVTQSQQGAGATSGVNSLIKHDAGVTNDSSGQQHVRGEHAEVAYVVDGVPLPDTLSGRQGAIVVLSTIQSLDLLTGAYAPEFGGQTAAVLDITTLPGARKAHADLELDGGSYGTTDGDLTLAGPLGKAASYVFDVGATRTLNAQEPQQPDDQTAHNTGSSIIEFGKLRLTPGRHDALTLTLSRSPDTLQINNRSGLPASFAQAGEGFGFLGLRNADGTRPSLTVVNPNGLGAQTMLLPSQQTDGQDIDQSEVSEFATLSWRHDLSSRDTGLLAFTLLHSGQNVYNNNPGVNLLGLPVDNSIEYNPNVTRNVHHVQVVGSLTSRQPKHQLKGGFLVDDQYGNESYQLIPGSQLALDDLAVVAPLLTPAGSPKPQMDANGHPVLDSSGKPTYVTDVNGNPVYVPTSAVSPTLQVHRSGFYRAAYLQDTWQESRRFTINYGVRGDWYKQGQNLGQPIVDTIVVSPRFNFSYTPDRFTAIRWSYNRLFNFPPLAQGAVVGEPIQPEILNQYDVSVQRQVRPGQTAEIAYYIKDIRNQVDTGLLVPGVENGIYSAVNFQIGGIHGIEFTYEVSPPKGIGLDAFVNYSYSIASPAGFDNTGAPAPNFNDHDQRNTVGTGIGYTWKGGANVSAALQYGSGLASSPIPPSTLRIPRSQIDLHFATGNRLFRGHGGVNLDVLNLFDERSVINFDSGFSGTRFMQGRRILLAVNGSF
jgi:outer membrane receptor protein involved in Fe transport